MSLVAELKRRNVIRVAILYAVTAWLLLQAADVGMSALGLPDWTGRFILLVLALGFPVALVLSWVYELTPEGIRRETNVERSQSITQETGRKLNVATGVLLGVAILAGVADRLWPDTSPPPAAPVAEAPAPAPAVSQPEPASGQVVEAPAAPAEEASIAVLPFVDMSPDRDNDYFSDGLTEELLNALAKIRALKVAGRTSSFAYKGKDEDLRVIGEQLGVANILEGSVRKAGNRLRITAQLINAKDGYHLWSETYDRELTDVFAIQSDIAEQVAGSLEVTLLGDDVARMEAGGTENIDAYNDYLQGLYLLRQGSRRETVLQAVDALDRALEKDPAYAQAWTSLGAAMMVLLSNAWAPPEEAWARLEEAQRQSRRYAPQLGGSYLLEAWVLAFRERRWPDAIAAIRRAAVLEPGNAQIALQLANMVENVTLGEESLRSALRSVELEPANLANRVFLGSHYVLTGDCDKAEVVLRQVIATDPDFPRPRYHLGVCHYLQGDYEGALKLFDAEPLRWMRHTGRSMALYKLGRKAEAEAAWDELVSAYGDSAAYQQAQVSAQWGKLDRAFDSLDAALRSGDTGVGQLLTDPLLEPLYADSRFRDVVERAGLLPFYDDVMAERAAEKAP